MSMDLFIIRHAWAGEFGDPVWPDDSQRPLTDEGRERFARMVAKLAARGVRPEVIATSPMVRCVETAKIVAEGVPGRPAVLPRDELLPGGDAEALRAWTAKQARHHGQVAWVGHAPDVGQLTAEMIGWSGGWIRFAKGTVAAIRFAGSPHSGPGELRWVVTAKVLGC
jgi:phosphohistidine phosphatase